MANIKTRLGLGIFQVLLEVASFLLLKINKQMLKSDALSHIFKIHFEISITLKYNTSWLNLFSKFKQSVISSVSQ